MELTIDLLEEYGHWLKLSTSSGLAEDFLLEKDQDTLARNARAARNYITDLRQGVQYGGPLPSALTIEQLLFAPPNDPDVRAWLGDEDTKQRLIEDSNVGMAEVVDLAVKRMERDNTSSVVNNSPDDSA